MTKQSNILIADTRTQVSPARELWQQKAMLFFFLTQAAQELRAMARHAEAGNAILAEARARVRPEGGRHDTPR